MGRNTHTSDRDVKLGRDTSGLVGQFHRVLPRVVRCHLLDGQCGERLCPIDTDPGGGLRERLVIVEPLDPGRGLRHVVDWNYETVSDTHHLGSLQAGVVVDLGKFCKRDMFKCKKNCYSFGIVLTII